MKIGQKLIGAFSIVALICAIVGGVGWYGISTLDSSVKDLGEQSLPAVQAGLTMDALLGDCNVALMELLNPYLRVEDALGHYNNVDEALAEIDGVAENLANFVVHDEDKVAVQEITAAYNEFKRGTNDFLALSRKLDEFGSRNPTQLKYDIAEIENAHRAWIFDLSETVVEGAPFNKQLDPSKCILGHWMANFNIDNDAMKAGMEPLAIVHAKLHESGQKIVDIFAKSKNTLAKAAAMDVFDNQAIPAMEGVVHHLNAVFKPECDRANDFYFSMGEFDDNVLEPAFDQVMDQLAILNEDINKDADHSREVAAEAAAMSNTVIIASIILGVIISLGFGVIISRGISRPVGRIASIADQIATGDIEHQIDIHSKDEIGVLADSFRKLIDYMKELAGAAESIAANDLTIEIEPKSDKDVLGNSFKTMVSGLTTMVRQLSENATQLVSAATEIASSSEQMSRGAKDQTDQVVQVSTAIEEMTATIVESSRNAGEATEGARGASETAGTGGEIVNETIQGMQRIASVVRESAESIAKLAKSADQIGEIIGVIDDIADQTNLLALNAAIEAARAGEQGRGFAVVADEVRKLAERTGQATGEITGMIKGIQDETSEAVNSMETGIQEVDKGRELADKAGNSLSEIVTMSQRVSDMIAQIATAAEEQSAAAEQIAKNVDRVSQIAKESATGAEQSATAAEQLNRQAEGMQGMVSQFKVTQD